MYIYIYIYIYCRCQKSSFFMIQTNHYDPELLFDLLFQYHKKLTTMQKIHIIKYKSIAYIFKYNYTLNILII